MPRRKHPDPGQPRRYKWRKVVCPHCGLRYREFRTGMSWRQVHDVVWQSRWSNDPDSTYWLYKRRNTVLGRWHSLKLRMWRHHVKACSESQAPF